MSSTHAITHPPSPVTAPSAGDAYLSLRELAAYSGMSLRWLRRALSDRVHPLPHYRPGGRKVLVRRTEFDRWMRQFRQAPIHVDLDRLIEETIQQLQP